jgi:hypothetical protein
MPNILLVRRGSHATAPYSMEYRHDIQNGPSGPKGLHHHANPVSHHHANPVTSIKRTKHEFF